MKALEGARLRHIVGTTLLVVFGVWLLLAMMTYSAFDPGWTHVSSDESNISNVMGAMGAWIADVLVAFVGKAAYLLPLFILFEATQSWFARSFVSQPFRMVGFVFVVIMVAVLFSLYVFEPTDAMSNAAGGIVGAQISHALLGMANTWLITAGLAVSLLLLITLVCGIHWLKVLMLLAKLPEFIRQMFYKNTADSEFYTGTHEAVNIEDNLLHGQTEPAQDLTYLPGFKDSHIRGTEKTPLMNVALHDTLSQTVISDQAQILVEKNPPNNVVQEDLPAINARAVHSLSNRQEPSLNLGADGDVFDSLLRKVTDHHLPVVDLDGESLVKPAGSNDDVFDSAMRAFDNGHKEPLTKALPEPTVTAAEWNAVAGVPEADPLPEVKPATTEGSARPVSHAMQTVAHRAGLSPLPSLNLLEQPDPSRKVNYTKEQLDQLSRLLEIKLKEFNITGHVIHAQPGPVVTRFELELAAGVKASKVTGISRDLARSLSMASVRVVEVIPGKPYIGIEVPNATREMVRLIELLQTKEYRDPKSLISMAMGKDISGKPVLTDLAKAPHMLVAGTTGSGKSVAVNAMLLSMLLKYTPQQLRLILIDPKQLELSNYNDIPHLLTPVVTDMKDAASALNWCVGEMERRYKLLSILKVRNLDAYNQKVIQADIDGEDLIDPLWKADDSFIDKKAPRLKPLPLIVVIADEFADMIMQVGKKSEDLIQRLAQKARAAGIHLILATQRPSVDVITGLIKANIPTRVALRVNSKIDSRTILDEGGAEYLLGHGDMLFLGPGKNEPERVHGAFISDDEVNKICDAWRERGSPDYVDEILTPFDEEMSKGGGYGGESDPERDAMYDQVVAFVLETRKVSASAIQRKFSLGYNRAARIVDAMEAAGIVSSMGASGKRDIIV